MLSQTFEEAVEINNEVAQGLSSSIFTKTPDYYYRWIGFVRWQSSWQPVSVAMCLVLF